jgi:hypothetical protein
VVRKILLIDTILVIHISPVNPRLEKDKLGELECTWNFRYERNELIIQGFFFGKQVGALSKKMRIRMTSMFQNHLKNNFQ